MVKAKLYAVLAIMFGLMLAGSGCVQSTAVDTGNGNLKVYVTDAPPDKNITGIMVTVSEVRVHRAGAEEDPNQAVSSNQTEPDEPAGGEWITIELDDDARTFDLLDVRGIEQYLGASQIEAAKYTQVRLEVETVQVEFDDSGEWKDARVPSNTLRIAHPFTILAGATTALVIDFDADRMVTVTGNGDVIVKPVVKVTTRQERQPGQQLKLEGTRWLLQSYGPADSLNDGIAGKDVSAEFIRAESTVKGSAGCNSYFGSYQLNGSDLSIGPTGNTEMFCMDPEGLMDQEEAYLSLLQQAEQYEITDDLLTINAGDQVLIFQAE